jgi:hypothetical protein
MKERFRNSGYRKSRDRWRVRKWEKGEHRAGWQYIKSMTVDDLDSNRQQFLDALKPKDRGYIPRHLETEEAPRGVVLHQVLS